MDTPSILFRCMRAADDGHPVTGASLSTLGIRERDVRPQADGLVQPQTGGMSVTPDRWEDMPKPLLPEPLGGEGRHPLFRMLTSALPSSLAARRDRPGHALVENTVACTFQVLQDDIRGTRLSWEPHEP
jgi:hypothetical protein